MAVRQTIDAKLYFRFKDKTSTLKDMTFPGKTLLDYFVCEFCGRIIDAQVRTLGPFLIPLEKPSKIPDVLRST